MTLRNQLDVEFVHRQFPNIGDWGIFENVRLIGRTTADRSQRVPTFSFTIDGRSADEFPAALATDGADIESGGLYARRCIDALGLGERGG